MAAAKIKGRPGKHRSSRRRKQERQQRRCQTRCQAGHPKRRKRKPNKKLYYAKSRFSLKRLNKILNNLEVTICLPEAGIAFAKPSERMYSYYQFRPRKIKITREGHLKGGLLTFVFAWIDWSFLRDLAAPHYSDCVEGGWQWDPVTLILLDCLRVLLHRDGRAPTFWTNCGMKPIWGVRLLDTWALIWTIPATPTTSCPPRWPSLICASSSGQLSTRG